MNNKSTNIYLIRHGEAAENWSESRDPGLSELGKQQSLDLLNNLIKRKSIKSIYTSPLKRAIETAIPLSNRLNIESLIESSYRELPSPQNLENRAGWLLERMSETWSEQQHNLLQWRELAFQALQQLREDSVIFSHYMLINAIVSCVTGNNNMVCFKPDNGSISHFKLSAGKLRLVSLGKELNTTVN
tara:strand:+ start:1230 stop:1790 length:561 start_codon:yes stop_codon:yes gene_type:complete